MRPAFICTNLHCYIQLKSPASPPSVPAWVRNRLDQPVGVVYHWTPRVTGYPVVYGLAGLRPMVLELWVDNGHVILVVHLGVCCAGVWVACTPRTCTIGTIHAPPGPRRSMGISDCHILVPYLWIRPISAWVRFGVKNQKKVDNAVHG